MSINRQMDKENMMHMECYSDFKRIEMLSFATNWINLKNIMLSEIKQAQKDKYIFGGRRTGVWSTSCLLGSCSTIWTKPSSLNFLFIYLFNLVVLGIELTALHLLGTLSPEPLTSPSKINTAWSHSHVESEEVELIEAENRMMVASGWGSFSKRK
jgi:hypothetical protein